MFGWNYIWLVDRLITFEQFDRYHPSHAPSANAASQFISIPASWGGERLPLLEQPPADP